MDDGLFPKYYTVEDYLELQRESGQKLKDIKNLSFFEFSKRRAMKKELDVLLNKQYFAVEYLTNKLAWEESLK